MIYGVLANLVRLVKIFPNNDPIMGMSLGLHEKGKVWKTMLFAFLIMVSFDIFSGRVGVWTIWTGLTYGICVFIASKFLRTGIMSYAYASIVGILIFDLWGISKFG